LNLQELKNYVLLYSKENEFDGVDLDFENIQTYDEWEAYLRFLIQASTFLHKHNFLATVALHPGQFLPAQVCQSLDRVHVMAYDMISRNSPTEHHASLQSVKNVMSSFPSNGCPSAKLIMGVPAYGRHESHPGLVKTYEELISEFISEQDGTQLDVKSAVNELNFWKGYRFDSAADVKEKSEYAKRKKYGGIFLWELGQDKQISGVADGGILIESASSVVYNHFAQNEGDNAVNDEL